MYAPHSNTAFSRAAPTSSPLLVPSPDPPMHHLSLTELDSLHDTLSQLSSSYGGSPSPLASEGGSMMQRSVSSQSLQQNGIHHHNHPFSALFAKLLDSEESAVRRVYSTGDLQGINGMQHNNSNRHSESPLSSESSMIIEGMMSRACKYSPEEKKARIERYRSKRNQRNFNKKIKYACRKTLADSRPRIRGRFARNEEIDNKNPPVQWSHIGAEEDEVDDDENWVSIFDSLVAANLAQESQGNSSFGDLVYCIRE